MSIDTEQSITEIVIEVQQLRLSARVAPRRLSNLQNQLLKLLQPTLRKVAQRFGPTARGSLAADDLVQVGAIEALKFVDRYNHALRGSQTFEAHVYRRALRACMDQIRLHSQDVHVADHAARGQVKHLPSVRTVRVESRDEPGGEDIESKAQPSSGRGAGPDGVRRTRWAAPTGDHQTPESLLRDKQLSVLVWRCIGRLPHPIGDLVARVHGIGRQPQSLREVARDWGQPRAKLDAMLKRGEMLIRKMIERETR